MDPRKRNPHGDAQHSVRQPQPRPGSGRQGQGHRQERARRDPRGRDADRGQEALRPGPEPRGQVRRPRRAWWSSSRPSPSSSEITDPIQAVNQLTLDEAREEGDGGRARRRAGVPDLLPRRGRRRGQGPGRPVRRHPQAQDLPARLRPHRRADRQAGHPAADPRCRAGERLQRVQGPQERDRHRHRPAVRARQHHRRPGPRRGGAPGARAGSARDLPRRGPGAGVRPGRAPRVEGPADHPLPGQREPPHQAVRDGGPGDRRGHRGDRGRGARAGRPGEDRRQQP